MAVDLASIAGLLSSYHSDQYTTQAANTHKFSLQDRATHPKQIPSPYAIVGVVFFLSLGRSRDEMDVDGITFRSNIAVTGSLTQRS